MKPDSLKQHFAKFSSVYLTQALFNGCFYGIRSIFVLFAINRLSLDESQAISLFATFMILCYVTSPIGGYVADKGLGVKNTVITGGMLSALGLLCILFPSQNLCFLGLALASLGSGFLKPNILTSVGLLFENPKDPGKDRAYSFLYMAMNLGSFVAPMTCGFVGQTYGWHYGVILISAVLAGTTYFVYKTMRFHPNYKEDLTLSKIKLFGSILLFIIFLYLLVKYREYFHSLIGMITCGSAICLGNIFYHCNSRERKDVLRIMAYVLLFSLFCALFEQAGTSMMLFYEKAVDRQVMGTVIPASAFLSLDPLFVLLLSPCLLLLSSKYLKKTKPVNGFIKMGCGFLFAGFSFGVLALSASQNNALLISPVWIVGATFIQVMGELWVAPLSFSKISRYAPSRYKSVLMSFWPMAIAYGHYFAGFIAHFSLKDATRLSLDNPFGQYQSFFIHLALLAACVGMSLILFRALYVISSSRNRRFLKIKIPRLDL
jgi:POT family proton-dependent oligopeptide transporter